MNKYTTGRAGMPPAVVIPPRGRAVLCTWFAAPGCALAPFFFWQGLAAGLAFTALWALLCAGVWARACSFVAAATPRGIVVYAGIALRCERLLPLASLTGAVRLRTPLLRLAGCSLLVLYAPGQHCILPAIPAQDADALFALAQGREGGL